MPNNKNKQKANDGRFKQIINKLENKTKKSGR